MLDWSKVFNIVFVAAACALTVFLLVSAIVVAVKGKRKCNAFDVILRIVAALSLLGSTVMLACAVLTMIDGEFCIKFAPSASGDAVPVFVIGSSITKLPMPELFTALASTVGAEIVAALFVCSIVALIVDCLVANKKEQSKPKKRKPAAKTEAQLRREAELAKIRRIGESAVKKTNAAIVSEQKTASESKAAEPGASDNTEIVDDGETAGDWREDKAERRTDFVGLKSDEPDAFDSFDTFDDIDGDTIEQNTIEQQDAVEDDITEPVSDIYDEQSDAPDTDDLRSVQDDQDYGFDTDLDEAFDARNADEDTQTDPIADQAISQDAERYDSVRTYDNSADDRSSPDDMAGDEADDAYGDFRDEYDEHISPDRDIYIPQMRTIVRQPQNARSASEKKPTRSPKPQTRANTERKPKSSAAKSTNGTAKKRTAQKSTATEPNIPAEKKLPVTRRYVILDRRNAVNMFGEYLKERNQTEKNKLESSINTIIIE